MVETKKAESSLPVSKVMTEVQDNGGLNFSEALNKLNTNVFCADRDFVINFANGKAMDVMRTISREVKENFDVDVNNIVGTPIDKFHKGRAGEIRKILSNPRNFPIITEISFAGLILSLNISRIFSQDGGTGGYIVNWDEISEKKSTENTTQRARNMLENAPINIMTAGLDYTLNYLNPKSIETLKTIEQYLPKPVEELIGQSIDIFHKKPAHQRRILSDPKNLPYNAVIKVGPELLDLLVTAIYDKDGKYDGPMVTWEVVTEKVKNENDMARFNNMIQNVPINIMLADLDFNIIFMNPKSAETLKAVQQYLPKPVDQLVGQSIDIFHKNPSKQRKIVGDPKNLPHRAKIKVGPETLDLLVSPLFDNNNKYLGPMVTWEIITQKISLVDTLTNTSNELASSSEELLAVAGNMTTNSEQTSEQATAASASSEEVSTGVQTVSVSMEEMSASIKEITKSTNESSSMSNEATKMATSANEIINQLGTSSQDIGNVIKVISSIAQQTNLLALNATIEAARAGEAGKGFAVVANEVKELAKETASATADITKKIEAIQSDSKGAVEAIDKVGKTIETLNNIAGTIASAVEEQAATTSDVTRVVQESTMAVRGITKNVEEVNKAAKLTTEGCSQTQDSAGTLNKLAASLKDLVKQIEV